MTKERKQEIALTLAINTMKHTLRGTEPPNIDEIPKETGISTTELCDYVAEIAAEALFGQ